MSSFFKKKEGKNIEQLCVKFRQLVQQEYQVADEHQSNDYWCHNGHNIGDDELAAVKMIDSIDISSENFESLDEIRSFLFMRLNELKKSYDRIYPDPDGFGAGTFHNIFNGLDDSRFLDSQKIVIEAKWKKSGFNEEIDYYEFENQLDDTLVCARFCLKTEEYLLAIDFIQIRLLQLSYRLFISHDEMSEGEVLLFSKQIREMQSMMVLALVKGRLPKIIYSHAYRYISGACGLLTFLQENNFSRNTMEHNEVASLPIKFISLSRKKAVEASEHDDGGIHTYQDGTLHYIGYRAASSLSVLSSEQFLRFTNDMFPSINDYISSLESSCAIIDYVNVMEFDDEWETIKKEFDQVWCFIIQRGLNGDTKISLVQVGEALEIQSLVETTSNTVKQLLDPDDKDVKEFSKDTIYNISRFLFSYHIEKLVEKETTIVIIPDGIIAMIPFSALKNSSGYYLVDFFKIIIANNFRSIRKISLINSLQIKTGLVVGNPDFDHKLDGMIFSKSKHNSFSPLPGTLVECKEISELMGWEFLSSQNATVENISNAFGLYDCIHIATHGGYRKPISEHSLNEAIYNPVLFFETTRIILNSSVIALAGANNLSESSTGLLEASDILEHDLTNLKIAFLSLCHGSSGSTFPSESLFGMARSFLANGTLMTIGSLHSVQDDTAKEFAIKFYSGLSDGESAIESFHNTQLWLKNEGYPWQNWATMQIGI